MRKTFGQLVQAAVDYCVDEGTDSATAVSNTRTFLKNELNNTISDTQIELNNYKIEPLPQTMSTVANQIYYQYPSGLNRIETATQTVGSVKYPLTIVSSQQKWDEIQVVEYDSSTIPKFIFPRKDDFGVYPTPRGVYTITLTGVYEPELMSAEDHVDGTVDVTNNSATVTGTSSNFTSDMVGRYFSLTNSDGNTTGRWYKISAYVSATEITLQNVFQETAASGSTYIIGESPELPVEMHHYLPFKAAAIYQQTRRRDPKTAQTFLNLYYTGDAYNNRRDGSVKSGVIGICNKYSQLGRANSQLVKLKKKRYSRFQETWTTTLSE